MDKMRPRPLGATLAALATLVGAGCDAPSVATGFDPPRGPAYGRFRDVTAESGVAFQYATPDFKGGGLAVGDLDGDGRPEILAGRRIGGLALFHNLGGLRFERDDGSGLDPGTEVTALALADLDNDGDRDLVIASPGTARVMANDGAGRFSEVARIVETGTTEQLLPTDLDGDGLLDLYFSNYDTQSTLGAANLVLWNRGGLRFDAVRLAESGLSWTTTAFDADGDGDQDLYVANDTLLADFGRPVESEPTTSSLQTDLVLRNDGLDGAGALQLTDLATELGMSAPRSSMGGTLGDFDGDGTLDLYVPNLGANKLFLRGGTGAYRERAEAFGVAGTARLNARCAERSEDEDCLLLSWSAALSDFDLDGHDELLVVNGETELGRPPPVLLFVRGAAPAFHEVDSGLGSLDARGMVVTDLDGDGDQDVVVAQKEAPLEIFETRGRPAAGRWLAVTLRGNPSNRDGVGAVVTIHQASGRSQLRAVGAGGVINSAAPVEACFGLGTDALESIDVIWPSGHRSHLDRPTSGRIVIDE